MPRVTLSLNHVRLLSVSIYSIFNSNSMKSTYLLLFLGLIPFLLFTSMVNSNDIKPPLIGIPIDELLASGQIQIAINGTATFNAQCISFDLTNKTSDTLCVVLESGKKLSSNSSTKEDEFVLKSKVVCIPPHQTLIEAGHVLFYQNPNNSIINEDPASKELTIEKWQKLSKVIEECDFPINAIQAAIWCITDNHPVSSIQTSDMKNIQKLRRIVSEIQKDELPWYYISYYEDTSAIYSNKYKNVIGNIEFYVQSSTIITINIRNKNDDVMATLINESNVGPGNHKFSVNASVSLWPKGEYTVYVYEDYSKVIARKTFEL